MRNISIIILTKGVVFYYNYATMAKITKRYCEGRKSPYQLFWIEDGIRHSRFFETEGARDDFLRLNGHLDKRSFAALFWNCKNTISDISYIVLGFEKYSVKICNQTATATPHHTLATIL